MPGRKELDTAGFKRIIASFSGKQRRFYITGGEPTLRKDLPELVKAIKAGGHRCLITTNAGSLSSGMLVRLAAAGADELVISLHGGPGLHDLSAGVSGAFRRVAAAAKLVRALPAPRPEITLWCTINRANHARLPEVYRAMAALKPDHIAFNHLEYISRKDFAATAAIFRKELGATTSFAHSEHLVRGIDATAAAAGIATIKKADLEAKFYPDLDRAGMERWYDPARSFKKTGRCSGQWNAAWFSPYGEILSCQPLAYRAGTSRPATAYSGPALSAFRRTLKKVGGFFPACGRCGREPYHQKRRGRAS